MSRGGNHWTARYRHVSMTRSTLYETHQSIRFPGKSVFQNFMLAQLISAQQVVILFTSPQVYLFYQGQVYLRPATSNVDYLPCHTDADEPWPIWTLIEVDYDEGGPPIEHNLDLWPIQTSSPAPICFELWKREYRASLFGMPQ